MNMNARDQYLSVLRKDYLKTESKKEKTLLLNEYCKNTHLNRKYVIRKINHSWLWDEEGRVKTTIKKRKRQYQEETIQALVKLWEIFDYPCGQRLKPLLLEETERLRKLGEINISDKVAKQLKEISSATIDRRLKEKKKIMFLKLRKRGFAKPKSLLYQKIPIRLNDWDTSIIGNLGIDFVEHCGFSKQGEYINTLSTTEIATGWWEGEGVMGKGQYPTLEALKRIKERTPFVWLEIHPDNDSAFINAHLFKYSQEEKIGFSRSRPNKKNDNCYIEQKNWTHVKKTLGYLRYDTQEELSLINSLYRNELRLYKNFFQPVMKLSKKTRIGGKVKRAYDTPKTPYQRIMASNQILEEVKRNLRALYLSLNPAQLKKEIEEKINRLYQIYEEKKKVKTLKPFKKQKPRVETYLINNDFYQDFGYLLNDLTNQVSVTYINDLTRYILIFIPGDIVDLRVISLMWRSPTDLMKVFKFSTICSFLKDILPIAW